VQHSAYLFNLDSRLGTIPHLLRTMTRAQHTAFRPTQLSNPEESNFGYVAKYESLKQGEMERSYETDLIPDDSTRRRRLWDEVLQQRKVDDVDEEEKDLFIENESLEESGQSTSK
jgi:hypothetical protein